VFFELEAHVGTLVCILMFTNCLTDVQCFVDVHVIVSSQSQLRAADASKSGVHLWVPTVAIAGLVERRDVHHVCVACRHCNDVTLSQSTSAPSVT
jgi:hypothetical protein